MPQRIQRKRTKGWRMPADTIYVGRPTIFGNPFRVFGENEYVYCDASHIRTVLTPWIVYDHQQDIHRHPATSDMVVELYRAWVTGEIAPGHVVPCAADEAAIHRLRGKNLACFCPLGKSCHADVLLELANR